MGEEFVEKLKSKFKEVALTRIQAEKEVCYFSLCVLTLDMSVTIFRVSGRRR